MLTSITSVIRLRGANSARYTAAATPIDPAIGQAVDVTGLEEFNNGKGAIAADRTYQVTAKPGIFAVAGSTPSARCASASFA